MGYFLCITLTMFCASIQISLLFIYNTSLEGDMSSIDPGPLSHVSQGDTNSNGSKLLVSGTANYRSSRFLFPAAIGYSEN